MARFDLVLVDGERIANEVFDTVLNEACGVAFEPDDRFEFFVGCENACRKSTRLQAYVRSYNSMNY